MKQIYLILIAVLIGLPVSAQNTKELFILHTNDTHSRIEPLSETDPDPNIAGNAGYVRRATFIKQMREIHPNLLLFDCGDISQGTPYYNMYKGELEFKLMNEMKYDAATIGNHEFDFGLDNMARLFKMANFPIVCANYDVRGTVLEGLVKKYIILKRNGIKIGVFGLSPEIDGLIQASKCEGVKYESPKTAAQHVAHFLKHNKKCDVVICLSHMGWKDLNDCDFDWIPTTKDVDVVLGGHSHTYMKEPKLVKNANGVEIPVQQEGKHGAFVGVMKLVLEKKK
ncbi:MAG: bifunctional metallophosphatase/5'-nucleotidase [Phocaeicola sp.]|uniref:bifunctional metallophosphatase/5'-nucleotidase n=1 Tax=Phocaeicola sp. TaxID=2773926 RepID=UPI003FA0579B